MCAQSDAPPPSRLDAQRRRLLVVEDDPITQEIVAQTLEQLGFECDLASSGTEGVRLALAFDYGGVLMDLELPGVGGFEAVRRIRALERRDSRVVIIAVTAHADGEQRARALEAGFDDYLTKPISPEALGEVLSRRVPHGARSMISAEIIELFFELAPTRIAEIGRALAAGDACAAQSGAHKLKGSCVVLGFERLTLLCEAIERAPGAAAGAEALLRHELDRLRSAALGEKRFDRLPIVG